MTHELDSGESHEDSRERESQTNDERRESAVDAQVRKQLGCGWLTSKGLQSRVR
jgi:hypothetical protein